MILNKHPYKVNMRVKCKTSLKFGRIVSVSTKKITVRFHEGNLDALYDKTYDIQSALDSFDIISEKPDAGANKPVAEMNSYMRTSETEEAFWKWFHIGLVVLMLIVGTYISYDELGHFDLFKVIGSGFAYVMIFGLFLSVIVLVSLTILGITAKGLFDLIRDIVPGKPKTSEIIIGFFVFLIGLSIIMGPYKALSVIIGALVGLTVAMIISGAVGKFCSNDIAVTVAFCILLFITEYVAISTAYNHGIIRSIFLLFMG